jgi:hypothetical protein
MFPVARAGAFVSRKAVSGRRAAGQPVRREADSPIC